MKHILLIFLILTILCVSCAKQSDNRIAIAILTPISHPSLEKIENGFKKIMEESCPGQYRFVTYNAQGNKTLMRSEIEEIIQNDYALVFTIGTSASHMTADVFEKKSVEIPLVFTCVNDPLGFDIVSSEQEREERVTGVKEMLHFEEELAALIKYKPAIKNLMLVYNPAEPGLPKDQKQIEQILKNQNIDLKTIEVFQTNEIQAKAAPFMSTADAVIILKDNCVVSGLEVLVKLCNQHQIPLMASDLDSPDRGAAFGYGVYEADFGKEGAYKALQILVDGVGPGLIPVTPVSNFILRINPEAAKKQGIVLP